MRHPALLGFRSGPRDEAQLGQDAALRALTREERLLLMRFVCAFAWADARIHPEERALVGRYVQKLGLDASEQSQVEAWLERPPPPESVDPKLVPPRHRVLFIHAIESLVAADGEIAPVERDRLIELAKLLR